MHFQTDGFVKTFRVNQLCAYIYQSSPQASLAAARTAAVEIQRLIAECGRAIGLFASGPSQQQFLESLVSAEGIEWIRVIGFQLNEYLGLEEDSPKSYRKFLIHHLVERVPMAEFHGIRGEAANAAAVCANYASMLKSRPPDFAVLGISETGELAFNDPAVSDFADPQAVKVVELDEQCRQRQQNDGVFVELEEVPRRAITLTIPTILSCQRLFLIAFGKRKARAVRDVLNREIATACPASILRTHPEAHLFLDLDAAEML